MIELKINGKTHLVDIESDTPLLWAIGDTVGLTRTKYGCGIEQCRACTVLIGKRPVRSCGITVGEVAGKNITTIEGLSIDSSHPVQKAWIAAVSLMQRKSNPTDKDIDRSMLNLCRCRTYPRIKIAIHRSGKMMEIQNA